MCTVQYDDVILKNEKNTYLHIFLVHVSCMCTGVCGTCVPVHYIYLLEVPTVGSFFYIFFDCTTVRSIIVLALYVDVYIHVYCNRCYII